MKIIDATAGSTHATDNAVKLYLPPEHATCVLAYLSQYQAQQTELERLKAEVRRLTPDDAHARECKTRQKEALVLLALDNMTLLADMLDATRCRRTEIVRDHLRENAARYGILKPPTHESVRKTLIKHGYV